VDVVLHLAEASPLLAKDEAARVRAINVNATSNIVKALEAESPVHLIFPSSVRVYGRTQHEEPPIRVDHPGEAIDNYSGTKIEAESLITQSSVPYTILRVTGAYSPELYEFPTHRHPRGVVPFMAEQRVEFMDREGLLLALAAAVENPPRNLVLNVAGGAGWRMRGKQFVQGVSDAVAVSGDVDYSPEAGCFDWYDTEESQRLLSYQRTDFHAFQRKVSWAFGYGLISPHGP
jgi:nucleoside-diphosphate-sugar epimerase